MEKPQESQGCFHLFFFSRLHLRIRTLKLHQTKNKVIVWSLAGSRNRGWCFVGSLVLTIFHTWKSSTQKYLWEGRCDCVFLEDNPYIYKWLMIIPIYLGSIKIPCATLGTQGFFSLLKWFFVTYLSEKTNVMVATCQGMRPREENPKQPLGMYRKVEIDGINYQPHLVIAGFLNQ